MPKKTTRGGSATTTNTTTADEMTVVFKFIKNSFDEVWAYLQPFKGELRAHVRIFTTRDEEEMIPTKKGISVSLKDLPKLADAVTALVEAVEEQAP